MKLKLKSKKHPYYGFALLEILIASVIGLALIEVILQSYLSAKHIYKTQNEIAHLSEDIRFAEFFLHQNITHAGFAGCRKLSELNLTNNTDIKFTTSDVIRGYANPDIIVITKANADITKIVANIEAGATSIRVEENPATEANKVLLISDCKNGELLIADNHKNKTINFKEPLKYSYTAENTLVSRVENIAFFISKAQYHTTKKKPIYSLYLSINNKEKQELIPEISNMQVEYGVDTEGHGKVTQRLDATKITADNLWEKVLSVVITLTPQNQLLTLKQWKIYIKLRERI